MIVILPRATEGVADVLRLVLDLADDRGAVRTGGGGVVVSEDLAHDYLTAILDRIPQLPPPYLDDPGERWPQPEPETPAAPAPDVDVDAGQSTPDPDTPAPAPTPAVEPEPSRPQPDTPPVTAAKPGARRKSTPARASRGDAR